MEKMEFTISDAFKALSEIEDDDIVTIPVKKRSRVVEGYAIGLNDQKAVEAVQEKLNEEEEEQPIQVIDVNADTLEHIKSNKEYVGQMIIKCKACQAPKFIDANDLVEGEEEGVYNIDDECPNCHIEGKGYEIVGQVGQVPKDEVKTEEQPEETEQAEIENTESTNEEPKLDNDLAPEDLESEEVGPEVVEEEPAEENTETEETEVEEFEEEEEKPFEETDAEDDTEELDLPEFGDEIDEDNVAEDDTETTEVEETEESEEKEEPEEEVKEELADNDFTDDLFKEDDEVEADDTEEVTFELGKDLFDKVLEGDGKNIVVYEDSLDGIKKIYEGTVQDTETAIKESKLIGFNAPQLIVNFDSTKEDGLLVKDVLKFFNDPDSEDLTAYDLGEDKEECAGSAEELIENVGDKYFVGFEVPTYMTLFVKPSVEIEAMDVEDKTEEDDLVESIISANGLRLDRIMNDCSNEYWINESIMTREDLDIIYQSFVQKTGDKKLIEKFKEVTGYKEALFEAAANEYDGSYVNNIKPYNDEIKPDGIVYYDKNSDIELSDEGYEEICKVIRDTMFPVKNVIFANVHIDSLGCDVDIPWTFNKEDVDDKCCYEFIKNQFPTRFTRKNLDNLYNLHNDDFCDYLRELNREKIENQIKNCTEEECDQLLGCCDGECCDREIDVDIICPVCGNIKSECTCHCDHDDCEDECCEPEVYYGQVDYVDPYDCLLVDEGLDKTKEVKEDFDDSEASMNDDDFDEEADEFDRINVEAEKESNDRAVEKELEEHERAEEAWMMNQVIAYMNNEEAYVGSWLYTWPDGETKDQAEEDFGEAESFYELAQAFEEVYKEYHDDDLYNAPDEVVEYAHKKDKEFGLKPINNIKPNKPDDGKKVNEEVEEAEEKAETEESLNVTDIVKEAIKEVANDLINEQLTTGAKNNQVNKLADAIDKELSKTIENVQVITDENNQGQIGVLYMSEEDRTKGKPIVDKVIADYKAKASKVEDVEEKQEDQTFYGTTYDNIAIAIGKSELSESKVTYYKSRKTLSEAVERCKNNNTPFNVSRSEKENYRYKLSEDFQIDNETEFFDSPNDDPNLNRTETVLTTPEMSNAEVECLNKLSRVAQDTVNAIKDIYDIEIKPELVVADMIQDLRLISRKLRPEDLEDTPVNDVTKQMFDNYNQFYEAVDEIVSGLTGEDIHTTPDQKFEQAIQMLDQPNFSTEGIREAIASTQFQQLAAAGQVPYIEPEDLRQLHEEADDGSDIFITPDDEKELTEAKKRNPYKTTFPAGDPVKNMQAFNQSTYMGSGSTGTTEGGEGGCEGCCESLGDEEIITDHIQLPIKEGYTKEQMDELNKLCDKVGIKTLGDLDKFMKEEGARIGEDDPIKALHDYWLLELGPDFQANADGTAQMVDLPEESLDEEEIEECLLKEEFTQVTPQLESQYKKLCKELGIKTTEDISMFEKEEMKIENPEETDIPLKDVVNALAQYRVNLGPGFKVKNEEFNTELFDKEINEYFEDKYEDTILYNSENGQIDKDGNIVLEGFVTNEKGTNKIKFLLQPSKQMNEELNKEETIYTVRNNLSEEVFEFKF